MKKNLNKKAFSLVELMVIIGIIGIMSSVVIVSLQRGRVEKELETSAREVSAAIREAQNNALTGKSASSTCSDYYFTYIAGSTYTVGGSPNSCPSTSYALKNGVTFESGGSFYFRIPFGGVELVTPLDEFPVDIKLLKGDDSEYHICVNGAGAVTEQKGDC